ncbi:hypothetical protein Tco_1375458 [Tanacetum coccineum]
MKWINSFVPMEEDIPSEKLEDDNEEDEIKQCCELAKEEEIAINAIPLATKVSVVGFQIHTRGNPGYYEIFRADGSSKLYHMFSQQLSDFDKRRIKYCFENLDVEGSMEILQGIQSTADTKVNDWLDYIARRDYNLLEDKDK